LARNSYYALKVSFCNNIYNLCQKNNIEYESFRNYFSNGEWVIDQHTYVPGPDGKLGFGGKCLPKDVTELLNFASQNGVEFKILEETMKFNETQRTR
jgi:UDP-glucose 6-dehydrogenase